MMDIAAYLKRIGYSGTRTPSANTLRDLHRAHLFSVPFENLDIGWGREIQMGPTTVPEHAWPLRTPNECS